MKREDFNRIHDLYVRKYPHLAGIKRGNWRRQFAVNAVRLAPPDGVTPMDLLKLNAVVGGPADPAYREGVED